MKPIKFISHLLGSWTIQRTIKIFPPLLNFNASGCAFGSQFERVGESQIKEIVGMRGKVECWVQLEDQEKIDCVYCQELFVVGGLMVDASTVDSTQKYRYLINKPQNSISKLFQNHTLFQQINLKSPIQSHFPQPTPSTLTLTPTPSLTTNIQKLPALQFKTQHKCNQDFYLGSYYIQDVEDGALCGMYANRYRVMGPRKNYQIVNFYYRQGGAVGSR